MSSIWDLLKVDDAGGSGTDVGDVSSPDEAFEGLVELGTSPTVTDWDHEGNRWWRGERISELDSFRRTLKSYFPNVSDADLGKIRMQDLLDLLERAKRAPDLLPGPSRLGEIETVPSALRDIMLEHHPSQSTLFDKGYPPYRLDQMEYKEEPYIPSPPR